MIIRKSLLALVIIACATAIGCSHYSVKQGATAGNEESLKSKFKWYRPYFIELDEGGVNYNRYMIEQSIKNSGDIPADKRMAMVEDLNRSLAYEPYRFFLFILEHQEAWGFGKDDFRFSMEDAKGGNIEATATPLSYRISGQGGSMNVHRWIIKTRKPLTTETATAPIKFSFKLLGEYELVYFVTPDK